LTIQQATHLYFIAATGKRIICKLRSPTFDRNTDGSSVSLSTAYCEYVGWIFQL